VVSFALAAGWGFYYGLVGVERLVAGIARLLHSNRWERLSPELLSRLDKERGIVSHYKAPEPGRQPAVPPCEPGDCMADREALGRGAVARGGQPDNYSSEASTRVRQQ
jgi:hypothetical protein